VVCKAFGASGKGAREELKALLTGGGKFIGSHVADLLIACGYEAIVVDDRSSGKRENVSQGARFYEMDVRFGRAQVFEEFQPQVLRHQAAQVDVRRSIREPNFAPTSTL
jgi:UDP-glucose 4-epimerase